MIDPHDELPEPEVYSHERDPDDIRDERIDREIQEAIEERENEQS